MDVIVIANQKGGVGKTTLTSHLGVQAVHADVGPVYLLDMDPQGSLTKWWNKRTKVDKAKPPVLVEATTVEGLKARIEQVRASGAAYLLIDTPPSVHSGLEKIIPHADMVVIPTQPSPLDLEAVADTIAMVRRNRRNMVFVINAASARAKLTGQAAIWLSQHGTIAPTIVGRREDFKAAMVDGRVAQELDDASEATKDMGKLWPYLHGRMTGEEQEQAAA